MTNKITIIFSICLSAFTASAQLVDVVTGLNLPWSLALKGNDLYIGIDGGVGQLLKVDITQPNSIPTVVLSDLGYAWSGGLAFYGNDLYIGDFTNKKVTKIDVTQPNPTQVDVVTTGISGLLGISIHDNYLYLADDGNKEITQIDLLQPTFTTVYPANVSSLSGGLAIKDNFIYFSDNSAGEIYKHNLSQPDSFPVKIVSGLIRPRGLMVIENFLYISEETKIRRINLSQPVPVPETLISGLNKLKLSASNGLDLYISQYGNFLENNGKVSKINISQPVFAPFAKVCTYPSMTLLGGASPTGGVYSGANVVDVGNGETFMFNTDTAGVGIHPINYTIGGHIITTNVEVIASPIVMLSLPDTFYMTQAMPLTGIGGGSPAGGVYSSGFQDSGIKDDGNGMTFSFLSTIEISNFNNIYYTYTAINGCSNRATEHIWVLSPTSGIDQLDEPQAYIFPNPTTGMVTLRGVLVQGVRVMDAMGLLMLEQQTAQQQIDLSTLPMGIYTLVLDLGKKKQATIKLLKE